MGTGRQQGRKDQDRLLSECIDVPCSSLEPIAWQAERWCDGKVTGW